MRKLFWMTFAVAVVAGLAWSAHLGAIRVELDVGRLISRGDATADGGCCCHGGDDAAPVELPSDPTPVDGETLVGVVDLPTCTVPCGENELVEPGEGKPVELAIAKGRGAVGRPTRVTAIPTSMLECAEGPADVCPMPATVNDVSSTAEAPLPETLPPDEAIPAGNTALVPPASEGSDLGTPPRCEVDPLHHHHYPSCPHSGHCPYSGAYLPRLAPVVEPKLPSPTKGSGDGEELTDDPPAAKPKFNHESRKPHSNSEPRASSIDTMEFRRTDRRIDEFGPGPFFVD